MQHFKNLLAVSQECTTVTVMLYDDSFGRVDIELLVSCIATMQSHILYPCVLSSWLNLAPLGR